MKLFLSITYKESRDKLKYLYVKKFNYRIFSEDSSFNKYFGTKDQVKIFLDILNKKLGNRYNDEYIINNFNFTPVITFNLIDK